VTSGFWNLRFTPATIPIKYGSYLLAHSEWAISLVVGTARQGGLEDGVEASQPDPMSPLSTFQIFLLLSILKIADFQEKWLLKSESLSLRTTNSR
jgi:hypothetical protein